MASSFFGSDALSLAAWRTLTDVSTGGHSNEASTTSSSNHHNNTSKQQRVVMQRSGGSHFSETDSSIQLSVDIPGVRAKELVVKVEHGILTISGSRKICLEGGGQKRFRFEKNFSIDADSIDVTSIKANLCNGVLILKAHKQKRAGVHYIQVTQDDDDDDDDDEEDENEQQEETKASAAAGAKAEDDSKLPPEVLTVNEEDAGDGDDQEN